MDKSPLQDTVLIPILTGAAYFAVDLTRALDQVVPHSIEFVKCKSYNGRQQEEKSKVHFPAGMAKKLTGKNIFILDELFDSGRTLHLVKEGILELLPKESHNSVHTITMMLKTRSDAVLCEKPDHWAMDVPDMWLVGYGLDDHGKFRNLEEVWGVKK